MKSLDYGSEKVKKICEAIKQETIEPALDEARAIVASATEEAARILVEAKIKADSILKHAHEHIAREKHVFETSLNQSSRQAVESLKQEIETQFFAPYIVKVIEEYSSKKEVVAQFVEAFIKAMGDKGIHADITIELPKTVSAKDLAGYITSEVVRKFIEEKASIGNFEGGISARFEKEHLKIDVSSKVIAELMAEFIRKDFRALLFKNA